MSAMRQKTLLVRTRWQRCLSLIRVGVLGLFGPFASGGLGSKAQAPIPCLLGQGDALLLSNPLRLVEPLGMSPTP